MVQFVNLYPLELFINVLTLQVKTGLNLSINSRHILTSNFFWIFISLNPLSWVCESFRRDTGQISTWKVFFIIKNIFFIMENLTDFRKRVEDGMDPCLMLHGTDTR